MVIRNFAVLISFVINYFRIFVLINNNNHHQKEMKRLACLVALAFMLTNASAQRLIPMNRFGSEWKHNMVSSINKPNGYIYRMRKDVQSTDLPRVPGVEELELFIAEPIDIGWMAFYRRSSGDTTYDFKVVLYNNDKQSLKTIDLCKISGNHYCEVQDVRWDADNHYLLFNMACPSYSDGVDGKCSKLYCYNVDGGNMVWESDYLVSNDIFILDHKYVYCSYGFTNERKYLYMLDKLTGKVYSKIPMVYSVQYMELQQQNGRTMLYAVDYNDHLFSFAVSDKSAAKKTTAPKTASTATKEPEVFTVVYATSDDGFLNVRAQPSTKGKILTKLYQMFHGLGNGVLREKGDSWSKVTVWGVTGWVYTKYLGYQTWYTGNGKPALVANIDNMPIYGEDYADEGEGYPLFTTVKKGTVIADDYDEIEEGYYVLKTGHDYLFIKKTDVRLK